MKSRHDVLRSITNIRWFLLIPRSGLVQQIFLSRARRDGMTASGVGDKSRSPLLAQPHPAPGTRSSADRRSSRVEGNSSSPDTCVGHRDDGCPARHPMASLRPGHPKQRIAGRDLATRHHLGVDPILLWPNARPRAATMSRSRFAVSGLTCVAAHLVIGEITRRRAPPRLISELIQSCSLQTVTPSK